EPVVLAVLPDQRQDRLAVGRPHGQHPGARHQADHGVEHTPALRLGGDGEQFLAGVEDLVSGTAGENLTGLPDTQFPKGEGVVHPPESTAGSRLGQEEGSSYLTAIPPVANSAVPWSRV